MASVDFQKLHGSGEVAAMLRHNDTVERLRHGHSNPDIDKALTQSNINYSGLDYRQTLDRYKQRISDLDSLPGANKRKDRVTAFSLVIPVPDGLELDRTQLWCVDTMRLMVGRYGDDNMISAHLHVDEVHTYYDSRKGAMVESRPHIHAIVVPEIDGRLCGKKFSSKSSMQSVNKVIDDMSRTKYGVAFLIGETPQRQRMERLKAQSAIAERKIAEKQVTEIQAALEKEAKQVNALKEVRRLMEKGNVAVAKKIIQTISRDITR